MSNLILPTSQDNLIDALDQMLQQSATARIPHAIEWYIAYHYLRGCRYFEDVDYRSGNVTAFYSDAFGDIPFRYEDILIRFQTEVGRLTRLDTMPAVSHEGFGLDYTRKAAVAHVVLDTLLRGQPMDAITLEVAQLMALYGTVGGTNWVVQEPGGGDEQEDVPQLTSNIHVISVIPPWELLPIPAEPTTSSEVQGICRERWVAYDWLKSLTAGGAPLSLPGKDAVDLQMRWGSPGSTGSSSSPIGDLPSPPPMPTNLTPSQGGDITGERDGHRTETAYVKLRETWVRSDSGRLARYIVTAGKRLLFNRDFEKEATGGVTKRKYYGKLPVMPITTANYTGGLGFFGRSFVSPLVSVNAEIEHMLFSLFRNIQDMDQFGYLFYPETWNIPRDAIEQAKPNRKVFAYSPDPANPNVGIHQMAPATTGELPARIAQMGIGLIDRLSQQPMDLMAGNTPGRLESGKSLEILYQSSTVPLGGPAISMAEYFSAIYRSILWNTKKWKALQVNMMSLLDDAVIGIKLDLAGGKLSLTENSIPDPMEVKVSIKSKEPIDKQARKGELMEMLKSGIITAREVRLINRRENLGMPTGNDVEWQNYLRAVLNNILLFNDGETPGTAFRSDYDIPSVHEYVILRMMAAPAFALAKPAVQAKFRDRLLELRALRGTLPNQAPYPEEAAAEADALFAQNGPGATAGLGDLAGGMTIPGADLAGPESPSPAAALPAGGIGMPSASQLPPDLMAKLAAGQP
jgi:hypothetical protein